jgi:hypothetical protein
VDDGDDAARAGRRDCYSHSRGGPSGVDYCFVQECRPVPNSQH